MIPVEAKTFPGPELSLDGILFLSFFFKLKIWIKRGFEAEEISKDLADCVGDMVMGLDGFDFFFIKYGWRFLESLDF